VRFVAHGGCCAARPFLGVLRLSHADCGLVALRVERTLAMTNALGMGAS